MEAISDDDLKKAIYYHYRGECLHCPLAINSDTLKEYDLDHDSLVSFLRELNGLCRYAFSMSELVEETFERLSNTKRDIVQENYKPIMLRCAKKFIEENAWWRKELIESQIKWDLSREAEKYVSFTEEGKDIKTITGTLVLQVKEGDKDNENN